MVGAGGWWWWVCKPILVIGFAQADQFYDFKTVNKLFSKNTYLQKVLATSRQGRRLRIGMLTVLTNITSTKALW